MFPVLVSVYRLEATKWSHGHICRRRAREGFVCVVEVRLTMIQDFASPGHAFDMLIKFREPCFQISLVNIPSYNKCSLGMCGFQFT